jgi:cycloeucalenol cycloisomerase
VTLQAAHQGALKTESRGKGRWLSSHAGKRATERYWLLYTPVWGAVMGVVMLSRAGDRWGDLELITLAVVLAAGALVGPIVLRPAEERGRPLHRSAGFKLGLSVTGFALLLNYSQTPFFFDVLHMHYGFRTYVTIRNNPVALYILTIPYFATYCALCLVAYRWMKSALAGAPRWVRYGGVALLPFGVAFLETALNANPLTRRLFCYDDMQLALWFGTFAYGTAFCLALPVWLYVDERPGVDVPVKSVLIAVAAAVYVDSILLDVYRYHLAPHVTTVIDGAVGLRDYGASCLVPPAP